MSYSTVSPTTASPSAEASGAALAVAFLDEPPLAGKNLDRELSAVFASHGPLEALERATEAMRIGHCDDTRPAQMLIDEIYAGLGWDVQT